MCATFLLAGAIVLAPAAAFQGQHPTLEKGVIKDVRAADGFLFIMPAGDGEKTLKMFDITKARFVGADKSEIKAGDLKNGDEFEVQLAADGKTAQQVRVVKRPDRP